VDAVAVSRGAVQGDLALGELGQEPVRVLEQEFAPLALVSFLQNRLTLFQIEREPGG